MVNLRNVSPAKRKQSSAESRWEMTLFDDKDPVAYLSALPVKGWD
jgi:hypothetical protein